MRLLQLALEQRCRELRVRGRRLEETLPRRIGSEEQREVLSLLCRVHELEVENTEMQSHALLRDGALRHRHEAVRRLEQHRSLCDEIIQGQRQIIDGRAHAPAHLSHPRGGRWHSLSPAPSPADYNLAVPQRLEELYQVYLRELEEGSLERATIMDQVASRALQVGGRLGGLNMGTCAQGGADDQGNACRQLEGTGPGWLAPQGVDSLSFLPHPKPCRA